MPVVADSNGNNPTLTTLEQIAVLPWVTFTLETKHPSAIGLTPILAGRRVIVRWLRPSGNRCRRVTPGVKGLVATLPALN